MELTLTNKMRSSLKYNKIDNANYDGWRTKNDAPISKRIHSKHLLITTSLFGFNTNFEMSYITTNRLNQDVLENLFSYLRAMGAANDRPTALNIRYRLRWYILGKYSADTFTEKNNTTVHDTSINETCLTSNIDVDMDKTPTNAEINNEDTEYIIANITNFHNDCDFGECVDGDIVYLFKNV